MPNPTNIIIEPMKATEIAFLKDNFKQNKSLFFRTMRSLAFICVLIPTVVWIFYALYNNNTVEQAHLKENIEPYTIWNYLASSFFLLALLGLGAYLGYLKPMQKQKKDIKEGLKIIERARITGKRFISLRKSFYFYLDSAVRLHIEVDQEDFERYREGDEINVDTAKMPVFI